ncbi:FAS1 domain [Macleaya cordata]|uniref:FAS1 domain n=1 Tax=Macleaya cordata TaxID=56857 RepID=A0A200QEH3_MACCD|nr:FAS1 domain [Macleaya cordata]
MASEHRFSSFFVFFLLTFSILSTVGGKLTSTDHETGRVYVQKIVNAISNAGYVSMSLTLGMTLNTLIAPSADRSIDSNTNTKFTIFCPPDEAFLSLKYPQPPFTLLKYHIVPMKLDRESLEYSSSSVALPVHSKIDTLLSGHPLVLTSFTDQLGFSSINFVNITKWELYNDGYVIVHGIENFFDPAYQTLLYPWYDNNNGTTNTINNGDKNNNASTSSSSSNILERLVTALREQYGTIMIWILVVFIVASFLAYTLSYAVFCCGSESCLRRRRRDAQYVQLERSNVAV